MQEVTVKARSSFRHSVTVDRPGQELVWNFATKRKNISFGLFRQVGQPPSTLQQQNARRQSQPEPASIPEPANLPRTNTITNLLRKRGNTAPLSPTTPPLRTADHAQTQSNSPERVTPSPSTSVPPSTHESLFSAENLTELIPISHFDSSKVTVNGSFVASEPGVYVLVFDNTFSVNTPKKLFFFVAVRDVNQQTAVPKQVEGWILKKGNRKSQGYLQRWLQINSVGILSYSKEPGGQARALIPLQSAAVRLDHDNWLIVIDAGTAILHMKGQNQQDFQMWVDCLQTHIQTSKFHATPAQLLRGNSNFSTDSSQSGFISASSDGWESALREVTESHRLAEQTVLQALEKVMLIKQNAEKPETHAQILPIASDLTNTINFLQITLLKLNKQTVSYSDTMFAILSATDEAFKSCLADNNKTRASHSLPMLPEIAFRNPVHKDFLPAILGDHFSEQESSASILFYDALENGSDSGGDSDYADDDSHLNAVQLKMNVTSEQPAVSIKINDDDNVESDNEKLEVKESKALDASADSKEAASDAAPSSKIAAVPPPDYTSLSVVRRTNLPAPPVSMENISVMSILRNNVGKDLSTIAMPIALNEPLNLLQKLAEELEYCELLDAAAKAEDPVERMVLISAFAVSGYASTVNRAGRKPFNPLLGETYECIRPDKGFRFISEKVSHHPPVMACYAESPNYTFHQDNLVKSKFWGKSMELVPQGTVHVTFGQHKEHYKWSKVTTCMRNVFAGTRYLEHYGTMKIESSSGFTSILHFKESGYFSSAKNEISGTVYDERKSNPSNSSGSTSSSGTEVAWLSGKWDEVMYRFDKANPNNLQVIWRAVPCPAHHAQMYGFTQFAVELNEVTPDIAPLLPPTDTRFRTDQRLYENGQIDAAEAEKLRLEQKQRDTRKYMEAQGFRWDPRWFSETEPGNGDWRYKGGYFESRGAFDFQGQGIF
ncbi:hypothetical protein HDU78_009322 [Chytriomyces hyalinus]|nr:hypothetical protein HDU78_009322 [Chytriomyces hyalinus]